MSTCVYMFVYECLLMFHINIASIILYTIIDITIIGTHTLTFTHTHTHTHSDTHTHPYVRTSASSSKTKPA